MSASEPITTDGLLMCLHAYTWSFPLLIPLHVPSAAMIVIQIEGFIARDSASFTASLQLPVGAEPLLGNLALVQM